MKVTPSKSTVIESSSSSFLLLKSPILNANIKTEDQTLDKNQSLSFIEKENSSYCEDKGSLKIDNGENQDSYKNDSSCAKISSSLTTTKDLEVAVIPKMSNPTSLLGNISTKSEKKAQQSDSFLNFNSTDALDSQGSSSSISNDNEMIDLDIKRRKENEIKNNKDISLKEKLNEYKSVTCKHEKSKRLVSHSSTIIPLGTHVEPKQTQEQSIAQTHKLSKTQVQKQVTSTESSKFNESEDDDDKRRGNDSNRELLEKSLLISNCYSSPIRPRRSLERPSSGKYSLYLDEINHVNLILGLSLDLSNLSQQIPSRSKSTTQDSPSSSFLSSESLILNANIETEGQTLVKNQPLIFIEKEKLYLCEDKGNLKINKEKNQDSYKSESSCTQILSSLSKTMMKDHEVPVITLDTQVEPKQAQVQSIAQSHKLSKTQLRIQRKSTESRKSNESKDDHDKGRGNDSNSETLQKSYLLSNTYTSPIKRRRSLARPSSGKYSLYLDEINHVNLILGLSPNSCNVSQVKPTLQKSTAIDSSPSLSLNVKSDILSLRKNQPLTFIEKEKSSFSSPSYSFNEDLTPENISRSVNSRIDHPNICKSGSQYSRLSRTPLVKTKSRTPLVKTKEGSYSHQVRPRRSIERPLSGKYSIYVDENCHLDHILGVSSDVSILTKVKPPSPKLAVTHTSPISCVSHKSLKSNTHVSPFDSSRRTASSSPNNLNIEKKNLLKHVLSVALNDSEVDTLNTLSKVPLASTLSLDKGNETTENIPRSGIRRLNYQKNGKGGTHHSKVTQTSLFKDMKTNYTSPIRRRRSIVRPLSGKYSSNLEREKHVDQFLGIPFTPSFASHNLNFDLSDNEINIAEKEKVDKRDVAMATNGKSSKGR